MREKMNNKAGPSKASVSRVAAALALTAGSMLASGAHAQQYPVTPKQRATAQQVASRGVPVSELNANAPETYVVKRGDTLWSISGMYLAKPWRWPELWGMNMDAIRNPHLIYPGQTLYLEKINGLARLSTRAGRGGGDSETVRITPRTRTDSVSGTALPTVPQHLIEPFLVEPEVLPGNALELAPRIVAATETRTIQSAGDRVYARSASGQALLTDPGEDRTFRIFRNAIPMRDPETGAILGYEAQYVGRAEMVRGETQEVTPDGQGGRTVDPVPATLDIISVKEEVRVGDRLLPLAPRSFMNYVPRAPYDEVDARVVSIYGSASVTNAGQNQVVSINRGANDGLEPGMILTVLTKGDRIRDKTDSSRTMIKLPSEANGMAMVFRTFDNVSYALLLQVRYGVTVGDRLVNPQ
ncbi:LysM peptidoglycan-binding domain-containing protein [Diaphorobacter aerolatus]|uniref:LysM peptidoglycan-binding domain-containing protein n=1 Tax=Diaphorobacter aerolatus TaxID=1288495 RepID=A0A7H0GGR5_9BURK|nr:LysM domain-containing protein [Diaphorobacter aerolatus]QNP47481.1 LysM peptidoglycan-binding domain-containing protein [Diaphorobacter aerolatus]